MIIYRTTRIKHPFSYSSPCGLVHVHSETYEQSLWFTWKYQLEYIPRKLKMLSHPLILCIVPVHVWPFPLYPVGQAPHQ